MTVAIATILRRKDADGRCNSKQTIVTVTALTAHDGEQQCTAARMTPRTVTTAVGRGNFIFLSKRHDTLRVAHAGR
jgi:hypothetical protein